MAITPGYSHYSCDVADCANDTYAQPDSDGADSFVTRTYIDAEGVERTFVLCSEHASKYKELATAMDAVRSQFITDGTGAIVSQADLDAANKALADMTKSRDTWWNNYQQIKAEYDAYRAAHPDTSDGDDA